MADRVDCPRRTSAGCGVTSRRWRPARATSGGARRARGGPGPRRRRAGGAGWTVEAPSVPAAVARRQQRQRRLAARLLRFRPYLGLSGVNLVARHPRSVSGRPVLVGAHLDTVRLSPGADDNASGVAALLEIARLLGHSRRTPAVRLAFFDLEELGLVGSSALARQLDGRGDDRPRVGGLLPRDRARSGCRPGFSCAFPAAARQVADGPRRLHPGRPPPLVDTAAWAWQAAAEGVGHRAVLLRDPRRDGLVGVAQHRRPAADAAPGAQRPRAVLAPRVPSLLLTDTASFRNPHYHRRRDRPETVEYAGVWPRSSPRRRRPPGGVTAGADRPPGWRRSPRCARGTRRGHLEVVGRGERAVAAISRPASASTIGSAVGATSVWPSVRTVTSWA